jgi:SAM-dependent methyltransferase/uncharacterized protein YbaR (Trm112 family)
VKYRLARLLRCPACRSCLSLAAVDTHRIPRTAPAPLSSCDGACPLAERVRDCDECASHEIRTGWLRCEGCTAVYPIEAGIPNLVSVATGAVATERGRTAARFGYMWARSEPQPVLHEAAPYHFETLERGLGLAPPVGLTLDAGCGDGVDLANVARRPGAGVVGVELSEGGARTSSRRTERLATAHVVRADLRALPFAEESFDFAYSYGVLHHMTAPLEAAREIARVLKRGHAGAVYVYEDFATRAWAWRVLLRVVNPARHVTTRFPPALLYAACWLTSPVVWLLCTVPARVLRRVPGFRPLAAGLPYRHGTGPWSLTGDLFDRFSAPIELRYAESSARALLEDAGLVDVRSVYERGWTVAGTKPT